MPSRRVAACAAALALITCVDADAPAFAVVRDPGAKGGNAGRLGPCGCAKGSLAPKMVAGQDEWTPASGYVPKRQVSLEAGKVAQSPLVAASSGGAAYLEDLIKGVVDPTQPAQENVSREAAADAQRDDRPTSSKTATVVTRVIEMLVQKSQGQHDGSQKWAAPIGYVPRAAKAVHSAVLEAQVQELAKSSSEPAQRAGDGSSCDQASSMPSKKWQPYGGYDPKDRSGKIWSPPTGYVPSELSAASQVRSWKSPAGYVPGWASQMGDSAHEHVKKLTAPTPSAAASSAPAQASAPVKTEVRATSSTDTLSSAPANKWQPYGGYDPKNRGASGIRTASASMAEQAYQPPAFAAKASIYSGPGSSTPAKNWEPYGGGYDPKTHTAPTPTAAVSNAPAQASAPVQGETRATWKSPDGYVPGWASQMGDSTRIAPCTAAVTPSTAAVAAGDALGRSLANRWESYGGYDPKKRGIPATIMRAHAQTRGISSPDTQSSAPAKSWSPPTGYVPSVSRPAQASKWEAYGGYDPKKLTAPTLSAAASRAPAQAPAPVKAEARATSSTDTLSSAPTKKWTPPIGYVPRRQGEQGKIRSWNSPAGYVPGWTSQMGDFPGWSSPSAGANGGDALGRSPAKKWEAYGGYDPKKLSAPTPSAAASKARAQASAPVKTEARATSSTDTLSSAPANKWQPYGGYDPKNRGASGIRTASASMAEQAYQPPAVAVKSSIVPGKNWESYGGYDPKYRKTVAAEVAPAASTRSVATSSSTTTPLNSAPAKKWQPYGGGYDPKKRGGYDPKNRGRPTPSAAGSASAANPSPARSTVTLAWGDQVLAEFERSRSPSSPPRGFSPGRPVQITWGDHVLAQYGSGEAAQGEAAKPSPARGASPKRGLSPKNVKITWGDHVLYDSPSSDASSMSSAPAKKWQPYGGYDPKNRGASGTRTASASMAMQAYQPPAVAVKSSIVPGNVGSDPKKSTASAVSTETPNDVAKTKTDSVSSAPAKAWSPPRGYVPSGSRPAQAVESKKGTPPISQAVTEKGQEIFRILVNTLSLSKTLVSVSGAGKYEAQPTEQGSMVSEPLAKAFDRHEELFKTLFNCLLLSQTALHQTLAVHGAVNNVVKTRGQVKLDVFKKSYPATARETVRRK